MPYSAQNQSFQSPEGHPSEYNDYYMVENHYMGAPRNQLQIDASQNIQNVNFQFGPGPHVQEQV